MKSETQITPATSDYRGPELPSDWDISSEDATTVNIGRPGFSNQGSALRLFQTPAATPLIAQRMMLPGGMYALAFVMRADKGPGARFQWEYAARKPAQVLCMGFASPVT